MDQFQTSWEGILFYHYYYLKTSGHQGGDPSSCMFMFIILQFSYTGSEGVPVHVVQLNFLQLLSATAKQTFTYHCLNSAAWLDTATHSHDQALRFRGANGEELTHENTHYVRALYDGCQVGNTAIHLTVHTPHFFFKSDCLIVFL